MAETRWTPGPWIFEPHNGYGGHDPDGNPWPFGYLSCATHTPIFELSPLLEYPEDEMQGAADLIAAAPELYEALANIVPRFERACAHAGSDEEFIAEATATARAALAKARGETP